MLPKPTKLGDRGHHAAMPYADLPQFMKKLAETPSPAFSALAFTVLTAARSGEVLGMTWDEVDFDTATWTVPAERMKVQKRHSVPLSDAAVAILRNQYEARGANPYVFPSPFLPRRPLSVVAMKQVMHRRGVGEWTPHGMRSAFRDWASDVAHAPFEVAEQCLAHAVGNAVSRSYARSEWLERRRPLMQSWADYVTGKTGDNAVPLRPLARADA